MEYQERLAARKREFGRIFPTLSENGNGHDTTIPAPMGWNYTRSYYPCAGTSFPDPKPLPCELKKMNLTRRFEY